MILVLITSQWCRFDPIYLSILPVLWHKCQRLFTWASCTSARHAGSIDCLMTSLIHSDYNGQRQRAVLQCSQTNPQRNEKRIMYAIKQIKICAEYWDKLPRPRLDLSGTPGSWQTSLGLGSMSRFSAQILTHWGRDKIDAISQTTFSSAFSWMKMYAFWLKFHWSLFVRVPLTIFQHWFR